MTNFIQNKILPKNNSERNVFLFILEGITINIILNLVNPYFSMFAKRLGAGDYEIGLINSVPSLVSLAALIPGAFIINRYKDKKQITGKLILLFSLAYPVAALTPFMGRPGLYVFIITISLLNWPFSVYSISWQSFFSDVVSSENRGLAYALRSRASTFVGLVTVITSGWLLSSLPHNNHERLILYQVFFVIAFVIGLIQRYLLLKINPTTANPTYIKNTHYQDTPVSSSTLDHSIHSTPSDNTTNFALSDNSTTSDNSEITKNNASNPTINDQNLSIYIQQIKDAFKSLLTNKAFGLFTLFAFLFHVAWQMGWPVFFLFQVDYLHANEVWLGYISAAVGITSVITYNFWGRMTKKYNPRIIFIIGATGLAFNPIISSHLTTVVQLTAFNIILGLTFSAFQLALFENLMDTVPKDNKTMCIAVYTTFLGISGVFAPMVGVAIMKATDVYFALNLSGVLRCVVIGVFIVFYIVEFLKKKKVEKSI